LDNTFADPTYDFPAREEAYNGLKEVVRQHKDYRIFLFSYYLGKEEVFINLAEDFETLVSPTCIYHSNFRLLWMKIAIENYH